VIEPRANLTDIDENSVKAFLIAAETAGRLPAFNNIKTYELLDKLRLIENKQLKKAAIILFGKDPGKFYPNTFVKIGRFGKDDTDLNFQEVEEGNIIKLQQTVLNQLKHKFIVSTISFEGMQRIEKLEYPIAALREMLLNALMHRNYMGAPIQIRVYDNKINIWNEGFLPEGITLETLKQEHPSRPRNPIIADVCFKGGYIDLWGRGTTKIIDSCKEAKLPEPEMKEYAGGFMISIFKTSQKSLPNVIKDEIAAELNNRQKKAIPYVRKNGKITNKEYQKIFNVSRYTATLDLNDLVNKDIFEGSGTKGAGSYYTLKK